MMGAWMVYATLVGALVAAGGWLLERALRPWGAPTRWIWAATVVVSVSAALLSLLPAGPAPVGAAGPGAATPAGPVSLEALTGLAAPPDLPPSLDPWLAGAWLALSALGLGTLGLAVLRLTRERPRWTREHVDGRDVLLSDDVGPAVVGILRSTIVIPRWALALDPSDRELMLRHEEEHRRAGDVRLLAGALLVVALLPWNLALWWQARRLRLAVEMDCDRRVLRRTPQLRRYALLLTEMGRRANGLGAGALAFARPIPFLERRIRIMTDTAHPRVARALGLTLLAGLLVFGACQVDRPSMTEPASDPLTTSDQTEQPAGPFDVDLRTEGGRVFGEVRSRETGEPLEGARVEIAGRNIGALTNARGRFLLLDVPEGTHDVVVTHGSAPEHRITDVGVTGPGAPATLPRLRIAEDAGVITGIVVHPDTGEPVVGAQVYLPDLEMGGLTNVQGRFLVINVPVGTHTLRFEATGVGDTEIEVEVEEGETTNVGEQALVRR